MITTQLTPRLNAHAAAFGPKAYAPLARPALTQDTFTATAPKFGDNIAPYEDEDGQNLTGAGRYGDQEEIDAPLDVDEDEQVTNAQGN